MQKEKEETVPVIDISPLIEKNPNLQEYANVLKQIDEASKKWGFYQIINHGVPEEFIEKCERMAKKFFELPESVKKSCARTASNFRGYYNDEYTKNKLDWKEGFDFGPWDNEGITLWPEGEIEFKETMLEFFCKMDDLASLLLKVYAKNLGANEDFFEPFFKQKEHVSLARLNHYPIYKNTTDTSILGVGPHQDGSALTILKQDNKVSGLQVYKDAVDNEFNCTDENLWVTIPPVEGAFVVNVGAILEVWSNMRYKAALHRVKTNPTLERFSMPFFYSPSYKTDVIPMKAENEELVYRSLNFGDYKSLLYEGFYKVIPLEMQARLPNYRVGKTLGF